MSNIIIADLVLSYLGRDVVTLKGDLPGHEFRGNQYSEGGGGGGGESDSGDNGSEGISGIKISNAVDAADALDTVGIPKGAILGIYSNEQSARSAASHAVPAGKRRAPTPRSVLRLQKQYAIIHSGYADRALHIPDSEVIG